MNSGATSERVYDQLKRRVVEGSFHPGERLDPARIGDLLGSSVTPVRDALNILVGEGLVRTGTGEGFHLPHMTEPDLQDLYEWNREVLGLSLHRRHRSVRGAAPADGDDSGLLADRTATLFEAIAAGSTNAEHRRAVASLNDRLWTARLTEAALIGEAEAEAELAEITDRWSRGDTEGLRRLIEAYHRRRRRHAAALIRAIYRAQ